MIGEDDIRRVRDATDLVALVGEHVVLRQRGREFWGNCPFHNEKTPSFKVDPASQFYHCFGCGEGGDAFKFTMKTENIEFPDAVRALAQRAGIELAEEQSSAPRGKKARLLSACGEAAQFYQQQLMRIKSPQTDEARAYLAGRGFGGTVATAWKLGYAPGRGELVQHLNKQGFTRDEMLDANLAAYPKDRSTGAPLKGGQLRDVFFNRIVFPIQDLQGRIIAFGGRIVGSGESGPKYLNSADTLLFHKRDNLYAIDRAKATITSGGSAIVVEGYTDVIAMHNVGFTQTVATLGTALTPQHLKLLARFTRRVVLLFDGDEAGQRAADRAVELISVVASPEAGTGADIFVAVLPGAQDPAEYCSSAGASAMQAVLDSAEPLLRFALDRRLAQWDLTQPEQRRRALDAVVPLLVPIKGTLLAADYLNYLADRFLTDYQTVSAVLDKAKPLPAQRSFERSSGGYGESGEAGGAGGASQPAGMRVGGASAGDSGSSVGSTAAQKTPEAARGGSKPFALAYELELLLLYIEHEVTRTRLREAFSLIPWGDDLYQRIADALLTLDVALEPDELLSRLVARCPEASSVLSGSRLPEFREVEPNRLAGMLMFSIKEEQLNSAVRAENAKLHRLAPEDKTAQEAIFKHIADLQQELIDLRKKYSKG